MAGGVSARRKQSQRCTARTRRHAGVAQERQAALGGGQRQHVAALGGVEAEAARGVAAAREVEVDLAQRSCCRGGALWCS
jgi:hypothetical protein